MLENTGQTETKVPNTLALVAAQTAVEQARKFQEQAREALERKHAEDRAREDSKSQAAQDYAVKLSVAASSAPAAAPETTAPVESSSRGAAVDLNA